MKTTDYRAILTAIEQAILICDKYGEKMDEARRKICEDLHRVRKELLRQMDLPPSTA